MMHFLVVYYSTGCLVHILGQLIVMIMEILQYLLSDNGLNFEEKLIVFGLGFLARV